MLNKAFSFSPSFPLHHYIENPNPKKENNFLSDEEKDLISKYPNLPFDIGAVGYNSDGRTLNATLWLSSPIDEMQSSYSGFNLLRYGMKIYVSDYSQPTFDVYTQEQNKGSWVENIIEYEPGQNYAYFPLATIPDYKGFFKNGSNFVRLSLDLNTIGSPDAYKVLFYTAYTNASINGNLLDNTGRFLMPPINSLFTWPQLLNPQNIKIIAGHKSIIPIRINSTEVIRTYAERFQEPIRIHIPTSITPIPGIKFNFSPSDFLVPAHGFGTTNLSISIPQDTLIRNLSIPVPEVFRGASNEIYQTINSYPLHVQVIIPSPLDELRSWLLSLGDAIIAIPLVLTLIVMIFYLRKGHALVGSFKSVVGSFKSVNSFKSLFGSYRNQKSQVMASEGKKPTISASDLLQIDGTIIAGVLIFLTIQAAQAVIAGIHLSSIVVGVLTVSIVIPFAYSALRIVRFDDADIRARVSSISGFMYLIAAVILIAIIR